jgi:hypothetical protein
MRCILWDTTVNSGGRDPLMQAVSSTQASTRTAARWIRRLTTLNLLMLAAQFLVGIVVNLFVQVPDVHPGAQAGEYFSGVAQGVSWALVGGALPLQAHMILGLLLFVASLAILGLAIVVRQRAWIITAVLGWLGIMVAGFNGASFLNYGHDFSSLLMSIGFLLAVMAYAIGLYRTR